MGNMVRCPSCRSEFELSAVMRSQLEAEVRASVEAELGEVRSLLAAAASREGDLLKEKRELAERAQQMGLDVERRVAEEATRIREQEAKAAQQRFSREAAERVRVKDEELAATRALLSAAASREADVMKKERELADREAQQALEIERRIAEATARVREQEAKLGQQRAELQEEQQRLRDEEHRQQIVGLQKTIGELQRRAQQGSQQAQGEAQEVVLRDMLAAAFVADGIDDVPKGVKGADVLQRVRMQDGAGCGAIIWESKRTRTWVDGWLPKVRDDQREAGAACAVIVTQVMPPDIRHFGQKDGVWVCAPSHAVALGAVLRKGLVEVALAKRAAEGSGEKMQLLYGYLTGTEFRNRVGGVVEAFVEMQEDLHSERRAMMTRWKHRERVIERAMENVTAFCGDLQGIVGRQLDDLPSLALEPLRALPPAPREEGEGGRDIARLEPLLFDLLPDDGSTVGNGTLTDRFVERAFVELGVHVTAADYERCKEALLADGRIRRAKGRGGSVCRAVARAAE